MLDRLKNSNGLMLIELLVFVVIGAFVIPASLIAFTSVMKDFSKPDCYVKSRFYAQQKLEELENKAYDQVPTRNKDAEPYPAIGTTDYRLTWEVKTIDPNSNPIRDGSDSHYKRISVFVMAPDLSQYKVHTIITERPK